MDRGTCVEKNFIGHRIKSLKGDISTNVIDL